METGNVALDVASGSEPPLCTTRSPYTGRETICRSHMKKGHFRRLLKKVKNSSFSIDCERKIAEEKKWEGARAFRQSLYGYYLEGRVAGVSVASEKRTIDPEQYIHMQFEKERKCTMGYLHNSCVDENHQWEPHRETIGFTIPLSKLRAQNNPYIDGDKYKDSNEAERRHSDVQRANGETNCAVSLNDEDENEGKVSDHQNCKEFYILDSKPLPMEEGAIVLCAFHRRVKVEMEEHSEYIWVRGKVTLFNGTSSFHVLFDQALTLLDSEFDRIGHPVAPCRLPVEYMYPCSQYATPKNNGPSPFAPNPDAQVSTKVQGALEAVVVVESARRPQRMRPFVTPKEEWPFRWRLAEHLRLGEAVWSRYEGGCYFRGIVHMANADGTFQIEYDDGDREERVPASYLARDRPVEAVDDPHRLRDAVRALREEGRQDESDHVVESPVHSNTNPVADAWR
eukprot:jgi/Bigna1/128164/aug1.6_g2872